ncbi:MAG TPA: hypothetical protein VME22_33345 [Solirubrobacteraceae bacterium]|nr:hypothetical protein [Solirubrobacteraceae bacterium]
MSLLETLGLIGIFVYVIAQQMVGSAITGRRLIVLPGVLTVIGILNISGTPGAMDIGLLALGGVVAVAIGLGLGAMTRLEQRGGYLWGQVSKRGLWLWAALILSRVLIVGIAHVAGAHVAASTGAILLMLGLNRVGQAVVVASRAIAAGIPFAPEKDGSVFGASWFSRSNEA